MTPAALQATDTCSFVYLPCSNRKWCFETQKYDFDM